MLHLLLYSSKSNGMLDVVVEAQVERCGGAVGVTRANRQLTMQMAC